MTSTTSQATIGILKEIFWCFDIPKVVIAYEFGVEPVFSNPQLAQSNGQVERYMQTVKNIMKKAQAQGVDYRLELLNYRNTPLTWVNASPAQLLFSRRLRSKVQTTLKHLVLTVIQSKAVCFRKLQSSQKKHVDRHTGQPHASFSVGDHIKYLNHNKTWTAGMITKAYCSDPRDYQTRNNNQHILKCSQVHLFRIPMHVNNKVNAHVSTVMLKANNVTVQP